MLSSLLSCPDLIHGIPVKRRHGAQMVLMILDYPEATGYWDTDVEGRLSSPSPLVGEVREGGIAKRKGTIETTPAACRPPPPPTSSPIKGEEAYGSTSLDLNQTDVELIRASMAPQGARHLRWITGSSPVMTGVKAKMLCAAPKGGESP